MGRGGSFKSPTDFKESRTQGLKGLILILSPSPSLSVKDTHISPHHDLQWIPRMNPSNQGAARPGTYTRLKVNQNHCSDLARGLEEEAKIPDTGDHGSRPQWSGTGPEAAGSSCRALWQSVRAPWSCSQSCAGGAAGQRKGRLTGSRGGRCTAPRPVLNMHCNQTGTGGNKTRTWQLLFDSN